MVRWTARDLPDLSGRTIVVTGATSGIGLVTARELARAGARAVLAVRDVRKGEAVASGMPGTTEVRALDLASLDSVRAFADHWTGPVDVLINNAGIMAVPLVRTVDGFEPHLGTNYLGPFLLTNLLLPLVTDRVVTLTSQLHRRGSVRLDDLNRTSRPYDGMAAYSDSKLYDLLFTLELQRRLAAAGSPVRSVAAHPGLAATHLFEHRLRRAQRPAEIAMGLVFNDAARGALPTLYAATQDVPGGAYVGPDGFAHMRGYPALGTPSLTAQDPDLARRLWDAATELTGG